MAKGATKAGTKTPPPSLYNAYIKTLEASEAKFALSSGDMSATRYRTNLMILDFWLDGGVTSGMYSVSGMSQSAKSTFARNMMGYYIDKAPLIKDYDGEGSVAIDRAYAVATMRQKSITEVYGKKKGGKYITFPKVAYSRKNVIENTFDDAVFVLNRIPDKVYDEETDSWFLKVANKNKHLAPFHQGTPEKRLSNAKFSYYPTDPYPQGFMCFDSYPAFVPRDTEEKEEQDKRNAQQAAAYSNEIKRIVAKLSERNVIWLGINQLRKKVRIVGRENPYYRPCGEAIYFYANAVFDMRPLSVPDKWQNSGSKYQADKYAFSYEPSAYDPTKMDKYAYKQIKIEKNKLNGVTNKKMVLRVHISDYTGVGRGIDPVWDAFVFLETIGCVTLRNKKGEKVLIFASDCGGLPLAGKTLTWMQFKTIVSADIYRDPILIKRAVPIFKDIGVKPFSFNKWAYSAIETGEAKKAYATAAGKTAKSDEPDLED